MIHVPRPDTALCVFCDEPIRNLDRGKSCDPYRLAVARLRSIAREDYRGPRPWSVEIAQDALKRLGES